MRAFLFCLALLTFTPLARAAEDGALSLSPSVIMLAGAPGQSTTQELTLMNGTSRPFSFDLVAQDVIADPAGQRRTLAAGSVANSIAATAVFSPSHVDVPPHSSASVKLTVTLPLATKQRAIVALFRGTNRILSGKVPMTASLGALLTFSASEDVRFDADALSVRPQTNAQNLGVSTKAMNRGSEPFVAGGVLAVVDAKGALVGRAALTPHRFLPGEAAPLDVEYAGELAPGRYRVFLTFDYAGRSLTKDAEVVVQ